jgi:release factor glutamine methyltransferase
LGKGTWTILKLIRWATERFQQEGLETPRLDAEVLLGEALNADRVFLYTHFDQPLQPQELERFRSFLLRRLRREPVAYIIGEKDFWSRSFKVTPDVLIPRPETEILVAEALKIYEEMNHGFQEQFHILEIGTGSGVIGVTLAKEIPKALILATDVCERALRIAEENARRHEVKDRIQFLLGDLFNPIPKGMAFDMIVTNPPYVPREQLSFLMPEVRDYEPHQSLDGGDQGLDFYRQVFPRIGEFLKSGGWFVGEIGKDQKDAVKALAEAESNLDSIGFIKDFQGIDRVCRVRKK